MTDSFSADSSQGLRQNLNLEVSIPVYPTLRSEKRGSTKSKFLIMFTLATLVETNLDIVKLAANKTFSS